MRNPLDPDPLVPDLQSPQLTQDVQMAERPGELDDGALDALHSTTTYNSEPYTQSFMRPGTHRSRHLGLLDDGLDQTGGS